MLDRQKHLDRPRDSTVEIMMGQLIAMVGNTGFRGFKEQLKPESFMPSLARDNPMSSLSERDQKILAAQSLELQLQNYIKQQG